MIESSVPAAILRHASLRDLQSERKIVEQVVLRREGVRWPFPPTLNEPLAGREILSTSPEAGEKLREGGTLQVVVSAGATLVPVPVDQVGPSGAGCASGPASAGRTGRTGGIGRGWARRPVRRVRRRDPEVRRGALGEATLGRRGGAGPHADVDRVRRDAGPFGRVRDPNERRPQVAVDVIRQGLER